MSSIRLIGILIVVGLIGGAYFYMKNSTDKDEVLRVSFPVAQSATAYEPTKIHFAYEYIFLENVFSPLVEFDRAGDLQSGVAERADWVGNELHLKIRDNLKTENGTPITAADVVFSLKRLLVLTGNTHGNFKDLVCPGIQLKTVEDDCPDIQSEGNTVIIKASEKKPFLLPMLAAIDFAIIPRSSCDPTTLKIVNFKETSGPYYVAKDDGDGRIELKLNPHHYHASKDIPQIVQLVPELTAGASLDAILNNKVDLITTVDSARAEDVLPFARLHPEFNLFKSMNIQEMLLVFTERGLKNLSKDRRLYIGRMVREAFRDIYKPASGYEEVSEFFPNLGGGGLDATQKKKLAALFVPADANRANKRPDTKIKLGLIRRGDTAIWQSAIQKYLPEANVYNETHVPDFRTYPSLDDMPHAFIASTDTSFMEDINLISYSLNAGLLGLTKPERAKWIAHYMSINDRDARMRELQKLHFDALTEPVIVPLVASPYTALARKPWRIDLSQFYANNQLWLIKRN